MLLTSLTRRIAGILVSLALVLGMAATAQATEGPPPGLVACRTVPANEWTTLSGNVYSRGLNETWRWWVKVKNYSAFPFFGEVFASFGSNGHGREGGSIVLPKTGSTHWTPSPVIFGGSTTRKQPYFVREEPAEISSWTMMISIAVYAPACK